MKKRYIAAAGLIGSVAAGAMVYKKVKESKEHDVILYPICRVTMHSNYPMYGLGELADKAQIIVRGHVNGITEARWNNKDNTQPKNITNKDTIFKDYIISIEKVFKGLIPDNDIIRLRSFEGEVAGFTIEDNSQIVLEKDQEILVFLEKDFSNCSKQNNGNCFVPVGGVQGVYIIDEDIAKNTSEEEKIDVLEDQINNLLQE